MIWLIMICTIQNEDIITKLETRLTISEKSSRSLLEEVVRLQNENKVTH